MKFIDMCRNVEKTHTNECCVDYPDIAYSQFNIDVSCWPDDNRLKAYYLNPHMCTDTWVGIVVYYLDGVFIGVHHQGARKCSINYTWRDTQSAMKLREYLLTLVEEEDTFQVLSEEDLNSDSEPYYTIQYPGQIVDKTAKYLGEDVTVVETRLPNDPYEIGEFIVVEFDNGEQRKVELKDVKFPMRIEGIYK